MDHNMPGITGAEAIKELKAHDAYKSIPIVLVSANNDIAELARDAGADAYFLKSKGYDQLVDMIATL
jgi:CheY-like chemotaxis protein